MINQLKKIQEKVDEEKGELKTKVQNIFTKIRNALNEREEKILDDIDKIFEKKYSNETIFKESEKLPKKIKSSLEKGKTINNDWKEDNLLVLINDCTNIENNTNSINKIKEIIQKCNDCGPKIRIQNEEEGINKLLEIINNFCNIYQDLPKLQVTQVKKKSYGNLFG